MAAYDVFLPLCGRPYAADGDVSAVAVLPQRGDNQAGGVVQYQHSTDVASPPVCVSVHPQGTRYKSCSDIGSNACSESPSCQVARYFAVGDSRGRVYVFRSDGDLVVEQESGRGLHSLTSKLNLRTFGTHRSR